jgi:hypothetical protein
LIETGRRQETDNIDQKDVKGGKWIILIFRRWERECESWASAS